MTNAEPDNKVQNETSNAGESGEINKAKRYKINTSSGTYLAINAKMSAQET